jgi:hypothetical protein
VAKAAFFVATIVRTPVHKSEVEEQDKKIQRSGSHDHKIGHLPSLRAECALGATPCMYVCMYVLLRKS